MTPPKNHGVYLEVTFFNTKLSEAFCLNRVVRMRIFPVGLGTFDGMILVPIPSIGPPTTHHQAII